MDEERKKEEMGSAHACVDVQRGLHARREDVGSDGLDGAVHLVKK